MPTTQSPWLTRLTSLKWTVSLGIILRLSLIIFGTYQDAHSPIKYTDIDYYVFTDAAQYVSKGLSPYARDTYRYTPLLAWLLVPTAWSPSALWFNAGKVLFAASDVVAGLLIVKTLQAARGMSRARAVKYANLWILNPMVAQISTRGSSEGLLLVIVVSVLWAVHADRVRAAGVLLGLAVHLKIYPFVYAASIFWWIGPRGGQQKGGDGLAGLLKRLAGRRRVELAAYSAVTFMVLNAVMYYRSVH